MMVWQVTALVVLLCVGVIFAEENLNTNNKEPTRPVFISSFSARVRASLFSPSHDTLYLGGGLFAYHKNMGFKRIELYMKAQSTLFPNNIYIHSIDRYDLYHNFKINYNRTCNPEGVRGFLEHPFSWIDKAHFTGESIYNDYTVENWEYMDEVNALYKVAVKKGTDIPVVFVLGNEILSEAGMKLELEVLEWKENVHSQTLSFIPLSCKSHISAHFYGDINAVIDFADNNWNCATPACDQIVSSDDYQNNYDSAEFVARSLAAGGYFPGLGPLDDQISYANWVYKSNTFNLLSAKKLFYVLRKLHFTSESPEAESVNRACVAIGDGGSGPWSHTVIGVGPGIDNGHNKASYHWSTNDSLYAGVDSVQCPPGISALTKKKFKMRLKTERIIEPNYHLEKST